MHMPCIYTYIWSYVHNIHPSKNSIFEPPSTFCEESSRVCIRKIAELLKGEAIFGVAKASHSVWSCIWWCWSLFSCVIQWFLMNWFLCCDSALFIHVIFCVSSLGLLCLSFSSSTTGFLNPQGGFRMTCNQSLVLENITEVLLWGENDNFSVTFRVYFLGKVKFWVALTYWKKSHKIPDLVTFWCPLLTWFFEETWKPQRW